jgi:hypothetical protein
MMDCYKTAMKFDSTLVFSPLRETRTVKLAGAPSDRSGTNE